MNRNAALDMLRGYALVCIMLNHMPAGVLRAATLNNFAVFDAAELFVLLSGFLVGLVWLKIDAAQGTAAARRLDLPVVHTFHALGVVKRRFLGAEDTSPPDRLAEEQRLVHGVDHIVATCSDELFELRRLGADPGRLSVVPCGVDLDQFSVEGPVRPASGRPRIAVVGRLVERKGVETVIRSLVQLPGVELVVAGGPAAG